ncbi:fumarylacetoacetate hydrolase family protein [Flavitalea sp.]|nr:fumarylacetoacetate hydrolase family protein [Flavitalea sp.]
MHLYKTSKGNFIVHENNAYKIDQDWDAIVNHEKLFDYLLGVTTKSEQIEPETLKSAIVHHLQVPVGSQELWAAGVTYLRSRDARMEESKASGAADCYSQVYDAERPELFFKALPHRISAHNEPVNIRKDSTWNVPEPELTLLINSNGNINGYTVGNDMSSRSIEGENPLYLPQAKMYERCAALGPCIYVPREPISPSTLIQLDIQRNHQSVFNGEIALDRMKRKHKELVGYLFREFRFPQGVMLMTGTGVVPPDDFTLEVGDEVNITIQGIGTLTNTIATMENSQ